MNYKEALFFIGKCLTISSEKENLEIVSQLIKNKEANWDMVVKVSTQHYVFPALYCNLKRSELLSHLPKDLVDYMKHITDLNRERNIQIIEQAKEINHLLSKNNIKPIFLKGTGFLLQDFYEDIAERMVGDIDFLVSEGDFLKTAEIVTNDGYEKTSKKLSSPLIVKHYPRLFKKNKISAVEIHLEMCKKKASHYFNYDRISESVVNEKGLLFLGHQDQLSLTILAKQYNDNGRFYKTVSIRNSYDIYLLSRKVSSLHSIKKYPELFNILNPYLAATSSLMNTDIVNYEESRRTNTYIKTLLIKLNSPLIRKLHNSYYNLLIYTRLKILGLIRFFSNKEFRSYYLKKILSS